MIFRDEWVQSHFDLRSWACLSEDFDVARVTKDLIECATKDDRQLKVLSSLQHRLEDIVRDDKFLLVLDDVWSSEEWDKLKAPLNWAIVRREVKLLLRGPEKLQKTWAGKFHALWETWMNSHHKGAGQYLSASPCQAWPRPRYMPKCWALWSPKSAVRPKIIGMMD